MLADTLVEARDNCAFGEPDEFNGLAEPDGVPVVARDAWSESVVANPVDRKVELALELERRVLAIDPRVTGARSTAFGDAWGESAIVSTTGIRGVDRGASCSVSTQPLARQDGETQTGFAHDGGRDPEALDLDRVASEAVERATRLLGATKPPSGRLTIVLEPRLAMTLLGIVSGMLAGDVVLKGRSPFGDRVGRADRLAAAEPGRRPDPHRVARVRGDRRRGAGLSSATTLIVDGVLQGFLRDSYTGRRTGLGSTGVGGPRHAQPAGCRRAGAGDVAGRARRRADLIASTDLGLFVNSFTGLHSGRERGLGRLLGRRGRSDDPGRRARRAGARADARLDDPTAAARHRRGRRATWSG